MQRLKILIRLVRNRFCLRAPAGADRERLAFDQLIFLLNLFPPYHLLCWAWVRAYVSTLHRSSLATRLTRALVRRGLLFGALRYLRPEHKIDFSAQALVPTAARRPPIAAALKPTLASLSDQGFVTLGSLVSPSDAATALAYFRQQNGYLAQTPLQSDGVLRPFAPDELSATTTARYFCFPPSASLQCPQVAALIDHPLLAELASAYLGYVPKLYSVNTFATIKGTADHYVMRLHRDYDDFLSLTFFVYWTDAQADDGATAFIPGSHRSSTVGRAKQTYLTGLAGTAFAIDTFGLHAGNRSVASFRMATWVRFGLIPNLATVQDGWLVPRVPPATLLSALN